MREGAVGNKPKLHRKRDRIPTMAKRSVVSNGRAMPGVLGSLSSWRLRFMDVMDAHTADLGGDDNMSEAQRSLMRRAATLTTELEIMESAMAKAGNGASDSRLILYGKTTKVLQGLLNAMGTKRVPKDVTPTVEAYLQHKRESAE